MCAPLRVLLTSCSEDFMLIVLVDKTRPAEMWYALLGLWVSTSAFAADMDGFKLLEHIGLELDLPVISEYTTA